jgi:hypothetical protein
MADVLMAASWLVLALLFTIAAPVLILNAIEIGVRAMNKPFVPQAAFKRRGNSAVVSIHRQGHQP